MGGLSQVTLLRWPRGSTGLLRTLTHRVAISNRRLITFDKAGVTFRFKERDICVSSEASHAHFVVSP